MSVTAEQVAAFNELDCRVRVEGSSLGRAYWLVPDGDNMEVSQSLFTIQASEVPKIIFSGAAAEKLAEFKRKIPSTIAKVTGGKDAG